MIIERVSHSIRQNWNVVDTTSSRDVIIRKLNFGHEAYAKQDCGHILAGSQQYCEGLSAIAFANKPNDHQTMSSDISQYYRNVHKQVMDVLDQQFIAADVEFVEILTKQKHQSKHVDVNVALPIIMNDCAEFRLWQSVYIAIRDVLDSCEQQLQVIINFAKTHGLHLSRVYPQHLVPIMVTLKITEIFGKSSDEVDRIMVQKKEKIISQMQEQFNDKDLEYEKLESNTSSEKKKKKKSSERSVSAITVKRTARIMSGVTNILKKNTASSTTARNDFKIPNIEEQINRIYPSSWFQTASGEDDHIYKSKIDLNAQLIVKYKFDKFVSDVHELGNQFMKHLNERLTAQ